MASLRCLFTARRLTKWFCVWINFRQPPVVCFLICFPVFFELYGFCFYIYDVAFSMATNSVKNTNILPGLLDSFYRYKTIRRKTQCSNAYCILITKSRFDLLDFSQWIKNKNNTLKRYMFCRSHTRTWTLSYIIQNSFLSALVFFSVTAMVSGIKRETMVLLLKNKKEKKMNDSEKRRQ